MNTISCPQESSVESKWQPDLEQRSVLSGGGRDQSGRAFNPQHTCKKAHMMMACVTACVTACDDGMCDGVCDGMRL